MTPENSVSEEDMWSDMASAIIGSGTYALEGQEQQQIEVLTEWLRHGRQAEFDWRGTYRHLYAFCATHRPLLPSPGVMECRVLATDAS